MRLQVTQARAVLVAFVILTVGPLVYAATRSWFWERQYLLAPVATVLCLLVLGALVIGRYRWAWLLLVLLYGSAIVSWFFDSQRFVPWYVVALAGNLAAFALLMSPTMRDRLRRPVSRPGARRLSSPG
jgi:hypothetical protein